MDWFERVARCVRHPLDGLRPAGLNSVCSRAAGAVVSDALLTLLPLGSVSWLPAVSATDSSSSATASPSP